MIVKSKPRRSALPRHARALPGHAACRPRSSSGPIHHITQGMTLIKLFSLVPTPLRHRSNAKSSEICKGSHEINADMHQHLELQLYQNLLLLLALNKPQAEKANTSPRSKQLPKDARRSFLDAVAYICDYEKGGRTCTAAALNGTSMNRILWLTVNQQSQGHRQTKPKKHVEDVLSAIMKSTRGPNDVSDDLLHRVIRPSRSRIELYRRMALTACEECIKNVVDLEQCQ